jgi:hypothetical protein
MKALYDKFVHYLYYIVMSTCMILCAIITVGGIYIMIASMIERMGK